MKTKKDSKNILPRLKVWLLMGRTITHNQCQKMWRSNRLSEYVRRLRHNQGMNIACDMVTKGDDEYGVYRLVIPKKVKKIKH